METFYSNLSIRNWKLLIVILLIPSFSLIAQLNGTYNIGSEGDYATINDAVTDITNQGISGPVVFQIANGTYNEQFVIGEIAGTSLSNTITFESASGNANDVVITHATSGGADNYIFRLSNATNIRLRNLSFETTGSSYYSRNISIGGIAKDIIIEGCNLTAPPYNYTNFEAAVLWMNTTEHSDVKILNNQINGGTYGVLHNRNTTDPKATGTVIQGNSITSNYMGVRLNGQLSPLISDNIITTTMTSGSSITFSRALYLYYCEGETQVVSNNLQAIRGSAFEMVVCIATGGSPGLIANNFMSSAHNVPTWELYSAQNFILYHNSINNRGSGTGLFLDRGYSSFPSSGNDIKNNIFRANTGYAMNVNAASNVTASDHNDFFTTGSNLAAWNGSATQTLIDLQAASGMEANSLSFDPQFVSDTDLHAQSVEIENAGTPLPEVTTDIDGESRDDTPSIGADEFNIIQYFTISTTIQGQGTVGQIPDAESYEEESTVQLSAIPAEGWEFVTWSGDVDPNLVEQNPVDIIMDQDKEINVLFVEELALSATSTPASCSNLNNGSIDLTVTGGSGNYFYDWDNDGTGANDNTADSEDLSNLSPGTYTVIVTDEYNLSSSLSVEITAESEPTVWYADSDNDGFGDKDTTTDSCTQPDGYVSNNTDCNDNEAAINPDATEIFDGIDNNCDGTIDEGFTDADGDGYVDDTDNCPQAANPDQLDTDGDGKGDECDPDDDDDTIVDEDDCDPLDPAIGAAKTWYADTDGDGFGDPEVFEKTCNPQENYVADNTDCNDSDSAIFPDENGNCGSDPCTINSSPQVEQFTAPEEPVAIGQQISISMDYQDDNLSNATWIWGDGYSTEGIISPTEVSGQHVYETPGVYSVTVIIEDECGNYNSQEYQYIVAYDPSGGFVTGAGWFYSPAGAYKPFPESEGDARFGFVSKYKRGARKPEGRTQFELISNDFSFISNDYDWLVVAGDKAMFKGTGEINGLPGYRFTISAIDDNENGDRFRIRIWVENNGVEDVIYDNQPEGSSDEDADPVTFITKGSIKIHEGKGKSNTSSSFEGSFTESFTLAAYPNPMQPGGLWLNFSTREQTETFNVAVFDLYGRQLKETSIEVSNAGGEYFWSFDHSGWEQGIYLLKAICPSQEFEIKLVK